VRFISDDLTRLFPVQESLFATKISIRIKQTQCDMIHEFWCLFYKKERKSLFTRRGSWVCGQPVGLSKRRSGNCEAVIHGRGISTAVSQSGPTGGILPFGGFYTRCTSLYTGKRRFFAIPYRLGHLSTLHLFWGLLGAVSAIFVNNSFKMCMVGT
jgi:hypothetical protein